MPQKKAEIPEEYVELLDRDAQGRGISSGKMIGFIVASYYNDQASSSNNDGIDYKDKYLASLEMNVRLLSGVLVMRALPPVASKEEKWTIRLRRFFTRSIKKETG